MKKSILIFYLALFAIGLATSSYGQVLPPQPITCLTPDALHPLAGVPYTYTINVPNPAPGTAWTTIHYNWWVTQDQNFMAAGALTGAISPDGGPLMDVTGGSGYNIAYNGGGTSNTITITWKSFAYDPALPVFLGILVTGDNGVPCTINNLKVYKIEPLEAFTLDIANIQAGAIIPGYGTNVDNCISNIVSATYQFAPEGVVYDYGENIFFYAVAAAFWSNSWQMRCQLANVPVGQTATLVWDYDIAFPAPKAIGVGNGTFTAPDRIVPQGGVTSVGAAGQTIYLRLTLDHDNTYEGIADVQYSLGVNGILFDGAGVVIPGSEDIDETTCAQVDFDDFALQTLKARPNIIDATPPAADDFLPPQ